MTRFRPFWRTTGPAERMIDWLADKQPDDWFHVGGWMHDPRVLNWILSQPGCDRAIAAKIFWTAWPIQFAQALAAGTGPQEPIWPVVERILRDWRQGRWPHAEFAWAPDREQLRRYRMFVARQPGRADPLGIPPDLFEPQQGREPRPSPETDMGVSPMNYLLFDLGTIPRNLNLDAYRAYIRRVELGRTLQLLAFAAIVMMGGAVILRAVFRGTPV